MIVINIALGIILAIILIALLGALIGSLRSGEGTYVTYDLRDKYDKAAVRNADITLIVIIVCTIVYYIAR